MIKLDKKLADEVIRLTRKYYKTGDIDYLPALTKAREVLKRSVPWQAVDLLAHLARYTQVSGKGTYDDIYKALAVFGIIVEDKGLEKVITKGKREEKRNDKI